MSGSSPNTPFDSGPVRTNCADLSLRTRLASPNPAVVSKLASGDILTIHLLSAIGPLQALTVDADIAGAILTTNPATIINCMNEGFEFQARVVSVNGGDCQIILYCSNP